jgi:hypothetical protein
MRNPFCLIEITYKNPPHNVLYVTLVFGRNWRPIGSGSLHVTKLPRVASEQIEHGEMVRIDHRLQVCHRQILEIQDLEGLEELPRRFDEFLKFDLAHGLNVVGEGCSTLHDVGGVYEAPSSWPKAGLVRAGLVG